MKVVISFVCVMILAACLQSANAAGGADCKKEGGSCQFFGSTCSGTRLGTKDCSIWQTCCKKSGSTTPSTEDNATPGSTTNPTPPPTTSGGYNNNHEANAKAHNTHKYRGDNGKPQKDLLILRRFQDFTINFPKEAVGDGVKYRLKDRASGKYCELSAKANGNSVVLTHDKPPVAIGFFSLEAVKADKVVFTAKELLVFLFNPWSTKDETHISDAHKKQKFGPDLDEHLMNEIGAQFQGSTGSYSWIPWAYNQFDLSALRVTMTLLERLSLTQRASPTLVSRWLSTAAQEVLQGNWSGDYSGGKEPWYWSSSTQITTQYEKKKSVVKFGQCWVFAGLLTTLLRTAGVPCTSMTNFDSAHEKVKPFKQECKFYNVEQPNGNVEEDETKRTCSVWNFHVWVDAWFKRPDLTEPAASASHLWQAVDATPQERSQGPSEAPFDRSAYFCGPASIALMQTGNYKHNYDSGFIGGESNAKQMYYYKGKKDRDFKLQSTDLSTIGETMISKAPDSRCNGESISGGSYDAICEENKARMYSKANTFIELETAKKPFKFSVSGENKKGFREFGIAHKAHIQPVAENLKGAKTAYYYIKIEAVSSNGKVLGKVAEAQGEYDIAKGQGKENKMEFEFGAKQWKEAMDKKWFKKTDTLKYSAFVRTDSDAIDPFFASRLATYKVADLVVECGSRKRKVGDDVSCTVSVNSRLKDSPLTGVKMQVELTGQGVDQEQEDRKKKVDGTVNSFVEEGASMLVENKPDTVNKGQNKFTGLKVKPIRPTKRAYIIATMTSNELIPVKGQVPIVILSEDGKEEE